MNGNIAERNAEIRKRIDASMRKSFDRYKSDYHGAVLFFRLGDFYEVYYEDADLIQRVFGDKRYQLRVGCADKYIKVLNARNIAVQIVEERMP